MGVSNLGDLVATATLDISPFATNTAQLKMLVRGLDNQMKIVENSFKGQSDKVAGLKAKHQQLGKVLEGNKALFANQARYYQNLKMETGSLNNATDTQKKQLLGAKSAMEATAAKVAELQNKYNALAREIATQSSVWTKMGASLTPVGKKLTAFGDSMAGVGKALNKGVTIPIMAGAGYAVKAAVQYESAFAGVKKTVDETATTSYEKLSNSIRQLSKELPASAVEIARVAEVSGQLGIKADNIMDFTKVMIDLGESTNLSAEDAASAIAKIANITGMTTDEYKRFGSSLVALGNNFATTEADILQMANRMASAGTIAGLTNQEILGLATAMSSVGIEAEAGGSAMSQTLVAIEKAVATGSDKLQGFADIAGMTAEQFTQKWKSSPAEALQSFISGLGQLDKKGESATLKLNELGLSGIRQSNMLKSLGLAAGTMTEAIAMSNDAWDKNRDLTDEANKRYETTESKLKLLRNEVTDVAIEFGGPLVDALRDGLKAAKPWIQSAADMAKAFSKLDKEQQQQIIKWGLIAASAGPALNILGNGISVTGSVFSGLGKASTALGKVSGALKTGTPLLSSFASSTATATAATGGLSSAVSLLGNPVTWGVLLGGAALVGIAAYSMHAAEAEARTKLWGTEVDAIQANELQQFKDKVDATSKAMETFGVEGKNNIEDVKQAYKELVDEINNLQDKKLAENLKIAESLGLSEEVTNALKNQADDSKKYVQQVSDEIIAIYQRHNNSYSDLTQEEQAMVYQYQTELVNKQLELMNYSSEEKIAIQKAMNGELSELNKAQIDKVFKQTYDWMEEEEKAYQEQKDKLLAVRSELGEEDVKAREEVNKQLEALEANHSAVMETYQSKFVNVMREKWEQEKEIYKDRPEELSALQASYKTIIEEYGLTWDEFTKITSENTEKAIGDFAYLGKVVEGMTEEATQANERWENLVWNEKDLKLKTNAKEEIQKALEAEGGWENLSFILKNATIDSNSREMIVEAMASSEQWNTLTINEKQLIIDGNQGMIEIATSQELLTQWNALTPEQKQLIAVDMTANPTQSAQTALNKVKQLSPAQLLAQNDTATGVFAATATLNKLTDKTVSVNALDNATPTLNGILDKITKIGQGAVAGIGAAFNKHARGTNFHPGGLAMVNDQKGSLYRELVTLPSGDSFIPEGRDVILPLPRGTKVLKASDTKKLFPRYANGIGFEDTKIASIARRIGNISDTNQFFVQTGENEFMAMLADLIATIKGNNLGVVGNNGTFNINVDARGKDAQEIANEIEKMLVRRIVR
ncbi:TPA: phage tail tape measure protein [Streptococcus suis]